MNIQSNTVVSEDLSIAQELLYLPLGFKLTNLEKESESQDYEACAFMLNERKIVYRKAKITPTKVGQFVTIWKRTANGPIAPFDSEDEVDLFIVSVRKGDLLGQFVFPKAVLTNKGIVTQHAKEGKRGIRVYPIWDTPTSKQALKSQKWQLDYFVVIHPNKTVVQDQFIFFK